MNGAAQFPTIKLNSYMYIGKVRMISAKGFYFPVRSRARILLSLTLWQQGSD